MVSIIGTLNRLVGTYCLVIIVLEGNVDSRVIQPIMVGSGGFGRRCRCRLFHKRIKVKIMTIRVVRRYVSQLPMLT